MRNLVHHNGQSMTDQGFTEIIKRLTIEKKESKMSNEINADEVALETAVAVGITSAALQGAGANAASQALERTATEVANRAADVGCSGASLAEPVIAASSAIATTAGGVAVAAGEAAISVAGAALGAAGTVIAAAAPVLVPIAIVGGLFWGIRRLLD